MCRKAILLGIVVLLAGVVSVSRADTITWTNLAVGDSSWCTNENWTSDTRPGSSDTAVIVGPSPDRGPIVGTGCAAKADQITGPDPCLGQTQVMDVNGTGSVTVKGWEWRYGLGTAIINITDNATVDISGETGTFRGTDNGISILNIGGSADIAITGDLRGGDESGWFYINMSGGLLDIGGEFIIGDNGGGDIDMSAGTIIVGESMDMGGLRGSAPINIDMTGGLIRVLQVFRFPGSASRGGHIWMNLDGGVIDCNEFVHGGSDEGSYTDDWRVDIEGSGELRIWGDVRDKIDANVAAGQITAYDGEGTVVVQLVGPNTVVTALPPDPLYTHYPDPPDKSKLIDRDVVLKWTEGSTATSHDVYFGTNFNDVDDATTDNHANVEYANVDDGNSYDPTGTLEYTMLYYWRVDAVAPGDTYEGTVWQFTTESPIIDPNMLVWYKLDEASGFTAADSSGYGNDGAVDGPNELWLPGGGNRGGCRRFDEDDGHEETVIDVPTTVLSDLDSKISISVWLKDNYDTGNDNWVFATGYGGSTGSYHISAAVEHSDGEGVYWRAGNDSNDLLRWDAKSAAEWHHYVFIKDEVADKMEIWYDTDMVASQTGVDDTISNIQGAAFKVGSTPWSQNYEYIGKMDDFKMFDKALTPLEVKSEFRGGDLSVAWKPNPADGEQDVLRDVALVWESGDYTDEHDVYFGTDFRDVNDADTTSDVYVDRREANSYTPSTVLALNTTYYWRIDEVNNTDPNIWKGKTWSFTVANYLVVDSFETYTCDDDMYDKWHDWYYNGTGSTLLLSASGDPTHTGDKSMLYSYNNSYDLYYSEAERVLGAGERDWTDAEVEALTLYFYGKSTNAAGSTETLNVSITDGGTTRTVLYGAQAGESMSDIQVEDWTEWNIALSEFSPVTLSNVTSMFVDFGQSGGSAGGRGLVYFDDFRLYPSRCIPAKGLMDADLSGNCVIDVADVGIMGIQWLLTDVNFPNLGITVTEPSAANLVGFWKLEGNGNDSSSKGNNGTPEGKYSWVTGYDSVNQAIEFGGGRVLVPDDVTLRPASVVSAACWIYYDSNPGESPRVVVKGPDNFEAYCIEIGGTYEFTFYVGDVNGTRYFADSNEGDIRPGEWIHLGGTYDGTTVKSYANGLLTGSTKEANSIPLSQDANGLGIGNRSDANDRPYVGIVDEVRVYKVALSQAEMAWLATDGEGYVPLRSKANLYKDPKDNEAINLRDYAELMLSWLDEKFWPRDY